MQDPFPIGYTRTRTTAQSTHQSIMGIDYLDLDNRMTLMKMNLNLNLNMDQTLYRRHASTASTTQASQAAHH